MNDGFGVILLGFGIRLPRRGRVGSCLPYGSLLTCASGGWGLYKTLFRVQGLSIVSIVVPSCGLANFIFRVL